MICALCRKEAELTESHLIPKLVYNRIKSHTKSRFRSLDNITLPMQDGEKHRMLCENCEKRFNAYETYFTNYCLEPYLSDGIMPKVHYPEKIEYYYLSVAWRILWDDLYRLQSFQGTQHRRKFEVFETELRSYLLNGEFHGRFITRGYKISDLIVVSESLANGSLFGYAFYNGLIGYTVIVCYAGLVIVTQNVADLDISDLPEEIVMEQVAGEMLDRFQEIDKDRRTVFSPDLLEKIKKRYQ